jgi:methionine-rich copper-binding protein CopC/putative copper export protein
VASAHAFVIASDPIDGSTIARKPREIRITFNAEVSPLSNAHAYFIQQGLLIDVGSGVAQIASSNTLVLPLQPASKLGEGSYMVKWSAVAHDDGHMTYGIIGFNIGFSGTGLAGTPILGPGTSNSLDDIRVLDLQHIPGLLMGLWEWFVLLALTLWIGMLVMERLVLADSGRGLELLTQARKRTTTLHWLTLLIMLAGDAALFYLRVQERAQVQFQGEIALSQVRDLIVQTNYGHIWLARSVLILCGLAWLYWKHLSQSVPAPPELSASPRPVPISLLADEGEDQAETDQMANNIAQARITRKLITRDLISREFEPPVPPPPPSTRQEGIIWLLFAAVLTLLFVWTSPAQVLQPHVSALVFSWLNLVALGLWFGGFAYLALILLPLFRRKDMDFHTETLLALQRRLPPYLLTGIGILIASALFLSDASVRGLPQIIGDPYGITLLVALGLGGLMVLLSLYVLFGLRPRLARQILLLPVVGTELPTRRVRLLELGQNGHRLKLFARLLTVLGAGMLLCLSLMDYFAPPIVFPDVNYSSAQEAVDSTRQTKQLGEFSVTVEVLPGQSAIRNTVVVLITDKNGQPVTDAQVKLTTNMQTMNMGTGHATIKGGQPAYSATFEPNVAFNMSGLWYIDVQIEREGQQVAQGQFQIVLPS